MHKKANEREIETERGREHLCMHQHKIFGSVFPMSGKYGVTVEIETNTAAAAITKM